MNVNLALQIITLLEQEEPEVQAGVIEIINLWKNNQADVKAILQGDVTDLQAVIDQARATQGKPPIAPTPDPDPNPPSA